MAADDYITCPYDPSHRILKSRMSRHLMKCELNHPTIKLLTCPFNKIHRISPLQYEHHLSICENVGSVQRNYFENASSISADIIPVAKINELELPPSSENWDEDPEPPQSYLQNLDEKNINFPLASCSKLKRKQLKLKEQERQSAVNITSTSSLRPQISKSTDKIERSLQSLEIESTDTECSKKKDKTIKKIFAETHLSSKEESIATHTKDTTIVKPSKSKDASIPKPSKDAPIVEPSTSYDTKMKNTGKTKTPTKKSSKSKDASIPKLSPSEVAPIVEPSTSNDTKIRNTGISETPTKTTNEFTLDKSRNDKDIKKNFSIGRGVSNVCEIHRKLGISKKNFESQFMNSQSDVKSEEKRAEINDCKGIFVGYSEEDFNMDMSNIEDELTDIDV
ncbi:titin homolog isoform X1 [Vespula pensylvanica]|uniref:titin homolog isoform X1 n=1 Tax=Vespula pensylvanica TaxID=30213 RepID=UPI001CB9E8FD|nr:titin homolog isoform X1 [Vespula pensylvanica]XP_043684460.1 titin homolog isoform X1 [Vespula pensylvanica]